MSRRSTREGPGMNSLFARLSLALLVIVTLAGGAFFLIEQFSTRSYHEEITQRLNAPIAMYVTGEQQLISGGKVDEEALALLARRAMIINPTVEIYLLDPSGKIIGHALGDEKPVHSQVDLAPIQALLSGEARMPLHGVDPRSTREKVFSAHPVVEDGETQGYLYAILGGQKYDELASDARSSYARTTSLGALLAILGIAFGVGLIVFGLLTRRLTRLTREVTRFTESEFDPGLAVALAGSAHGPGRQHDEIAQLRQAFGRMANRILEQVEGLKETDRLRRELYTSVSHDLRTPLSSIHGYVETLLIKNERLTPEAQRHYLEITRKHTRRLGRLIGDLFELSKLESPELEPRRERFSLAELLQDVAQEFELEARQKDVQLTLQVDTGPAHVFADIGLVQRVLENLLRNALRHTPPGGKVTLMLDPADDAVAVTVADTGCGISQQDIGRVFDRFYRGEEAGDEEQNPDSTGLGLAIVKRILDLHGSRITVTSEPERGTRFEFALPIQLAA